MPIPMVILNGFLLQGEIILLSASESTTDIKEKKDDSISNSESFETSERVTENIALCEGGTLNTGSVSCLFHAWAKLESSFDH